MPLQKITSEEQRISRLIADLRSAAECADLSLQHVFSSHLVLESAGHIENSIILILSEYGRINGNPAIRRFVEKTVARNNSLNCEKIRTVSDQFNLTWWPRLMTATSDSERDAVDSLKTLRDQIAHGHRNGTGLSIVEGYFSCAKVFVQEFSIVVLGY